MTHCMSTYILGKNIENKEITGTLLNLGSLAADYATSSSDDDVGDTEKQKGICLFYIIVFF